MASDVYELEVLGDAAGEPTTNVLAYELAGGGGGLMDNLNRLIIGWYTNVEPAYVNILPADFTLLGYKARRINNGGSPTMAISRTGVVGGVSGTGVDAASGGTLLQYYNSDPTPKFPLGHVVAGKTFIPYAPETYIEGNKLSAGYLAGLASLQNFITSGFTESGTTYNYVIWSKKFSKSFGPFDLSISAKVGIQRRRLLPSF